MNILIIGCGYLGLAAGIFLREKGHKVTGITRSHSKLAALKQDLDHAILINKESLPLAFKNQDIILFTAAADNADSYKATYLDNAQVIIEAFHNNPSLKQVIYTSSTSVYGEHDGKEVNEDTSLAPLTPQSQILIDTENTLRILPQSCIFRLGELIGRERTIADRLVKSSGITMAGTGESITNLSPVSDVIRAIDFAIEKPLFGTFNLCSSRHTTRKELYKEICEAKGLADPIWDASKHSLHGGNKTVISKKLIQAGFTFEANSLEGLYHPCLTIHH